MRTPKSFRIAFQSEIHKRVWRIAQELLNEVHKEHSTPWDFYPEEATLLAALAIIKDIENKHGFLLLSKEANSMLSFWTANVIQQAIIGPDVISLTNWTNVDNILSELCN